MSDSTRGFSLGCFASGLAFLIVLVPGVTAYYLILTSETAMWWFIGRFQGVTAIVVIVGGSLAYCWGLVGFFKIVRAGLRAMFAESEK
jgi:hypothetical protein